MQDRESLNSSAARTAASVSDNHMFKFQVDMFGVGLRLRGLGVEGCGVGGVKGLGFLFSGVGVSCSGV